MKLNRRVLLLRTMAILAINASIYAGVITLRMGLFGVTGGMFALPLFVITMVLGHLSGSRLILQTPAFAARFAALKFVKFLTFMLKINDSARFAASLTAWIIILLPFAIALVLFGQDGITRSVFELLLLVVTYIIAMKQSKLTSSQIMSKGAVYTCFFILAASLELAYFLKGLSYLKPWHFGTAYFFIFAFLIIKNQEDIDTNIFNKKHVEKSVLPRNMRRFNVITVSIVFVAVLLLFNLKSVVMVVLDLAGRFIFLVIQGVLWMMDKVLPDMVSPQDEGGSMSPGMFQYDPQPVSPYGNLMFNTLKNFLILYLLYRVLVILFKRFPSLLQRIAKWLKRLFAIKVGEKITDESDFIDETETLRPEYKHTNHKEMMKNAKKRKKNLKDIKDPVEKVRYMYASILHLLPLMGVRTEQSDTSLDIAVKAYAASGEVSEDFKPFTVIYNQVRYGNRIPDNFMMTKAVEHYGKTIEKINRK